MVASNDGPPHIHLWYGDEQIYGKAGRPQRWANVLGRITGPRPIKTASYSLNGQPPLLLSIGPDQRRLVARGDFNIDLDLHALKAGVNTISITATDEAGYTAEQSMTLTLLDNPCPFPYAIDWDKVTNIQDIAHVVDGLWKITGNAISPVEIGYDRLLAIGDMAWQDYEITVPITVHGINGKCYDYPSVHAGVGIVMHWKGHNNWGADPYATGQPYFGPSPYGAIGWYCAFHETGTELNFFDTDFNRPVRTPKILTLHQPYMFKVRSLRHADGDITFSLKVWEEHSQEPEAWALQTSGNEMSLREGSLLLGAHHVAASFGNVKISAV